MRAVQGNESFCQSSPRPEKRGRRVHADRDGREHRFVDTGGPKTAETGFYLVGIADQCDRLDQPVADGCYGIVPTAACRTHSLYILGITVIRQKTSISRKLDIRRKLTGNLAVRFLASARSVDDADRHVRRSGELPLGRYRAGNRTEPLRSMLGDPVEKHPVCLLRGYSNHPITECTDEQFGWRVHVLPSQLKNQRLSINATVVQGPASQCFANRYDRFTDGSRIRRSTPPELTRRRLRVAGAQPNGDAPRGRFRESRRRHLQSRQGPRR